jgi:hypothetical protein
LGTKGSGTRAWGSDREKPSLPRLLFGASALIFEG